MITNYLVMYGLMGAALAASLGAFAVAGWVAVRVNGYATGWRGLLRYALFGLGLMLVLALLAGEAVPGVVLLGLCVAGQALVAGYLAPRLARPGPSSKEGTVPRWRFVAVAVPLSLLLFSLPGAAALFILGRALQG
jgi:hypothetical protein